MRNLPLRSALWVFMVAVALLWGRPVLANGVEQAVRAWVQAPPESPVLARLRLAPGILLVDDPAEAQVAVVHDTRLPADVARRVEQGELGLLLIPGPHFSAEFLAALRPAFEFVTQREAATLEPLVGETPLLRQINWRSAPQVRERSTPVGDGWDVLVQVYRSGEPVLARLAGHPRVYWFSPWQDSRTNTALVEWPYYDYLLYALVSEAAGAQPVSFAEWPLSPVPHKSEQRAIAIVLALMVGTTVALFLAVRRYSLRHPEHLTRLVADPNRYRAREAATGWEDVGFHRPLAGFLVLLAMGLFLFIPFMIYQTVVVPRFLVPSAQVLGAWGLVFNFFNTFWILFDMGTSLAMVKYLSEYRVDNPAEGIKFAQLFVWWQAITGTVQLGLVALLAAFVVPHTRYAFLAYYIVLHALIQFPGFLRIFQYLFRAFQRLDYDQIINVLAQPAPGGTGPGSVGLALIAVQSVVVLAVRAALDDHPLFGRLSGAVGLGLGLYFTELSIFAVGFWLYRRLGYAWRVVFLAHFTWETVRKALSFGAMITLGGVMGALGWSVQVFLMERGLFNYTEIQGNLNIAFGLLVAFSAIGALYQGVMPALSEAYSHGYRALSAYYLAQGFKYGGWFSGFIAGSLLAVADRFILGSLGEEWVRAAQVVGILIVWGIFQFPAWFSDSVQQGAGKPWLVAAMLFLEQAVRIGLLALLIGPLQLWGVIAAYLVALPLKDLVAWLINARLILRPRLGWWQTVGAPLLAGSITYATLRALGTAFWRSDLPTSLLLFFVAIVPALPYYCFWHAVLGGWDNRGLAELRRAARMTPVAPVLDWLICRPTRWGARWGLIHNRFPLPGSRPARAEARQLTRRRVELVG